MAAMQSAGIVVMFALASACATPGQPVVPESKPEVVEQARRDIQKLRDLDKASIDERSVLAEVEQLVAEPSFKQVSPDDRRYLYWLEGHLLYDLGEYEAARKPLEALLQDGAPDEATLRLKMALAAAVNDVNDEVATAIRLFRGWPDDAATYDDVFIIGLLCEAKRLNGRAQQELAETLFAAQWKPRNEFRNADEWWLGLVASRLDQGDLKGATEIALTLHDPRVFVSMHSDKRFDALIAANPTRFDVLRGFGIALAELKAKAAANPDSLYGVNAVAGLLLTVKRAQDALSLVDDALARLRADENAFTDAEAQRQRTLDYRSGALFALGRTAEGLDALRAAAAEGQRVGADPISQTLDLASALADHGFNKEALAELAKVDRSKCSAYGVGVYEGVRARASFAVGDIASFDDASAFLEENVRADLGTYLYTTLYAGQVERAARVVVAALEDPARRVETLTWLNQYRRPAAKEADLLARPEVAAALEKYGHLEPDPLAH